MPRDSREPAPLNFDETQTPVAPRALRFDEPIRAPLRDAPDTRPAVRVPGSVAMPLFDTRQPPDGGHKCEPGKELFGEHGHPLLNQCFEFARQRFAQLYPRQQPRIERAIRQLLPLRQETLVVFAGATLKASGDAVEALTRLMRDFADLNAAELMRNLLAKATHKPGFVDKISGCLGVVQTEPDYRAVMSTLKASLGSFPPRIALLKAKMDDTNLSIVIALASLSAVAQGIESEEGGEKPTVVRTLHDRRDIVLQASQQLELSTLQVSSFEAEIASLISRADQLMNVTLPAAIAARQRDQ